MLNKRLRQMGSSWGLVIPKVLLYALNINPVLHEVSITIEGEKIVITKRKDEVK